MTVRDKPPTSVGNKMNHDYNEKNKSKSKSNMIFSPTVIDCNEKENKDDAALALPDVKKPADVTVSSSSSSMSFADVGIDPWAMPELQDNCESWSDLSAAKKRSRVLVVVFKLLALMSLLYFFFCSLDFLSSAFRLLGGKAAGEFFRNSEHLRNPVVGLMLGILTTVLMQSSSTSTSIVVTMVASNFLDVPTAIPIIMGANIGTSVTNTLVSLAQSNDRSEFRRAFAGATVHDVFNWLTVIVLLPLESATGYLYHLTNALVDGFEWKQNEGANKEILTVLTRPFTDRIIQLDKKVLNGMATGEASAYNRSLIKEWCKLPNTRRNVSLEWLVGGNESTAASGDEHVQIEVEAGRQRCVFLLNDTGLDDSWVGLILLGLSLVLLSACLILMVKVLHSMLRGQMATVIKHTLNADFPGRLGFLTGYVALLVGCGMTILVQSSSIFTSALTPLVGIGVISVERMYPLTLGSNIGTTTTGLLASLAASGDELKHSIQIALCHLFFNVTGILLFYPLPFMRFPVPVAKRLGDTTAKYRWFSIVYLVTMFLVLPSTVFAMSAAGPDVLLFVGAPIAAFFVLVVVLNVMQSRRPSALPSFLRTWEGLPDWMHSLRPWDRWLASVHSFCVDLCGGSDAGCCCCCCGDADGQSVDGNLAYMYDKPRLHPTPSQVAILPTTLSTGNLRTIPSVAGGIDNPVMLTTKDGVPLNVITRV